MKRRDAGAAAHLSALWQRAFSGEDNKIMAGKAALEAAFVLADGLNERGYVRLAHDLTKLARGYELFWREKYPYGASPKNFRHVQQRVERAIKEIASAPQVWIAGRPKTQAMIRFYHAVSPSPKDVAGPYPASAADFVDLESIRRWWKKIRRTDRNLGRISSWRKEKGRIILFPSGFWTSIVIEPGRAKPHVRAREIEEIASDLRRRYFASPWMKARRLYRMGLRNNHVHRLSIQELAERYGIRQAS